MGVLLEVKYKETLVELGRLYLEPSRESVILVSTRNPVRRYSKVTNDRRWTGGNEVTAIYGVRNYVTRGPGIRLERLLMKSIREEYPFRLKGKR